jgi:hypothetical protein
MTPLLWTPTCMKKLMSKGNCNYNLLLCLLSSRNIFCCQFFQLLTPLRYIKLFQLHYLDSFWCWRIIQNSSPCRHLHSSRLQWIPLIFTIQSFCHRLLLP